MLNRIRWFFMCLVIGCAGLAGCSTLAIRPEPVRFATEDFTCPNDPGAWSVGADDKEIATNGRLRLNAGQACRTQLWLTCRILKANDQLIAGGACPADPRTPASVTLGR